MEPSLYAADFSRLGEQIEALLAAGTRVFHFDVGDGHFVPPVTMGPIVLQSISPIVHRGGGAVDCHLMVEQPERHFAPIAEAGGDSVTFHLEAAPVLDRTLGAAREAGLGVGIAFNPETAPAEVAAAAGGADLVLCMSIHPGYSGQPFMPETYERIRELRRLLPEGVRVQVDGGVTGENVVELSRCGADLFVCGTSIFGGGDPAGGYAALVGALEER